jgi:hypothetical protein
MLLFIILMYILGAVGLMSIGLFPIRSWQVLKKVFENCVQHPLRKVLVVFVVLLTIAALWADVRISLFIFRCLTKPYCGPNIASGWINLAYLGGIYLIFEIITFPIQRFLNGSPKKESPDDCG